jgi:murein DD-endopeptidase MepM/ murein hydrolase activator NlpD
MDKHLTFSTRFVRMLVRCVVLSFFIIAVLNASSAFAEDTSTTTTTTPLTVPTTTPKGDAPDTPLPGDTAPTATTPAKQDSVAQENANKANSKLDKATQDLINAQIQSDLTSQQLQATTATLADLNDKISKNEAIIAIKKLPVEQMSKIIKKRAVTLYQDSEGAPTDAVGQFYYNRQNALAGTAQKSSVKIFTKFQDQLNELKKLEKSLNKQKKDADTQAAQLQDLSTLLTKQLDDARKKYEKTATLFLDAHAVGAKVAIDGKMCPIAGPMTHTDDWHNPRSGGRLHLGNDIFNALGTPNVAIVSGTVQHQSGGLGGTAVKLFGDDGNDYYYAHLSAFAGPNRHVEQGEVIGYTGNTGNAAGGAYHTHFEIRIGGTQHIDPYPIIRIICGV